MVDHTSPCKDMRDLDKHVVAIGTKLDDHISVDLAFRKEVHEEFLEGKKDRAAMKREIHDLESRISKDIRAAFKDHEATEATMSEKSARRVSTAIETLSASIEAIKSDRHSLERKLLFAVVSVMGSGVGILLAHLLTEG